MANPTGDEASPPRSSGRTLDLSVLGPVPSRVPMYAVYTPRLPYFRPNMSMEPKLFDPRNPEPPLPASDYRDVPLPPDRGFYTSVSVWRKLPAETPVASSSGREEGDSEGEDAKMGDLIGAGDGLGTGNDPDTTAATSASHAQSPAPPASAPPCSTSGATDSSTAQDIFNTSLSTQDKIFTTCNESPVGANKDQ